MAISKNLSFSEFKNVCININENMTTKEVFSRWNNYLMFRKTIKDGSSPSEVGATINPEELED